MLVTSVFAGFAGGSGLPGPGRGAARPAWSLGSPASAQTGEEIEEFFAAGVREYDRRRFRDAATEFENVLLLDPRHLRAKVMLARCCLELKMIDRARSLWEAARKQAPKDPKVRELSDLLETSSATPVPRAEGDLVLHETLTLLGSATAPRPYGLVVPPAKVVRPGDRLGAEITGSTGVDTGTDDDLMGMADFDDADFSSGGPRGAPSIGGGSKALAPVFRIWAEKGLNGALEAYYDLVKKRQDLLAEDDQGLLAEAASYYRPRAEANPRDIDSAGWYVLTLYLNGAKEQAWEAGRPVRGREKEVGPRIRAVLNELEAWHQEEEIRRQEILAAQQQAAAEAAAASAALLAATSGVGSDPAGVGSGPEWEVLDQRGYDAYKKGKLDDAIACYQASIRLNPNAAQVHYHLGLAFTDKGLSGDLPNFDRAIEAFNQVIRLEPGSRSAKDAEVMIKDIQAAKTSLKP